MKTTTSAFLRVNNFAQTVFVHTLLQKVPTILAWLRTPKSSVHSVPHDNQGSTLQLREISQTLDNVHFCVNRLFPVSAPLRSGPHLVERRGQYFITPENDCMMKRCVQRMHSRNMLGVNILFHCCVEVS
jgi:hypothetical protein